MARSFSRRFKVGDRVTYTVTGPDLKPLTVYGTVTFYQAAKSGYPLGYIEIEGDGGEYGRMGNAEHNIQKVD